MNKVVHIPAYWAELGENRSKKTPTGEKAKNHWGLVTKVYVEETEWVKTGISDCRIDSLRLSKDLANAIETLNNDGYEVVTVTPITSGTYDKGIFMIGDGSYGYGYSYTNSLIVTARKIN